jgi:hypothetical protein
MVKNKVVMTRAKGIFCGMLLAVMSCSVAEGQTLLRWDLKAGDKLNLEVTQKTTAKVAYAGKETTTQIDMAMELQWDVLSVEAGKAKIRQTLAKVQVNLESPGAGKIAYDSSAAAKPAGRAKDLALGLEPLLRTPLELTMTERGEILEVTGMEKRADKGAKAEDNPLALSLLADDSIQRVLRQPLMLLPEKAVNVGEEWSREGEIKSGLGAAKNVTKYRYVGSAADEGEKVEKIEATMSLTLNEPAKAGHAKLKEHKQSGEYRFSTAAGRLFSAKQKQMLVTERPYRETVIVVSLESTQETTVK